MLQPMGSALSHDLLRSRTTDDGEVLIDVDSDSSDVQDVAGIMNNHTPNPTRFLPRREQTRREKLFEEARTFALAWTAAEYRKNDCYLFDLWTKIKMVWVQLCILEEMEKIGDSLAECGKYGIMLKTLMQARSRPECMICSKFRKEMVVCVYCNDIILCSQCKDECYSESVISPLRCLQCDSIWGTKPAVFPLFFKNGMLVPKEALDS
ncbi:unnamed protein product [Bursaphelenchus xylophilus]|uniref:(pine wood nematode) hypothetical protein n=1 Tax=Bursaphelenchus xylophilus TaxID=6326 RepID=A0A1I7RQN6_BURXY|nr:unnamed protein product [Bursaphelenchus xylophilus]CAG9104869.1 unnamed protein product [Bursaphelenchus xylophilus]